MNRPHVSQPLHLFWLTLTLAKQTLKERYAGTTGGTVWLIVHPLALLAVLWFVFSVGFRVPPHGGTPFILVIFAGLIPWMSFNEALSSTVSAITSKAFLVRKIAFPLEILPIVPVVAALVPHVVLLVILIVMAAVAGVLPGWHILALLPYMAGWIALAASLGLLMASLSVFVKDLPQVLTVVLNIWFWWTPIVWTIEQVPARFQWIVAANPLVWVVEGYRAALLGLGPVVPSLPMTLRFVVLTGACFALGIVVFKRLRPHFGDVL